MLRVAIPTELPRPTQDYVLDVIVNNIKFEIFNVGFQATTQRTDRPVVYMSNVAFTFTNSRNRLCIYIYICVCVCVYVCM